MKNYQEFDVAVVGAGPAGSAAAYWLAKEGHRVVLIDKHSFPREKACGDGLTPESMKLLAELGLEDLLKAHYLQTTGFRLFVDSKGFIDQYYGANTVINYGMIIPRSDLDNLICKRAAEQGAVFWDDSNVVAFCQRKENRNSLEVERKGLRTSVQSKYIVAADGANSVMAKKAGLAGDRHSKGYALRGYYDHVPPLENKFIIHVPLMDPQNDRMIAGYGWVFPTGAGSANIGVGFFPVSSSDGAINIRAVFNYFLEYLTRKDPRFVSIKLKGRLIGAPLNSHFKPQLCIGKRIILAGDAAGLVDPFTGEGISCALVSGKLAAKAVHQALAEGDRKLSVYADLLAEEFKRDLSPSQRTH